MNDPERQRTHFIERYSSETATLGGTILAATPSGIAGAQKTFSYRHQFVA